MKTLKNDLKNYWYAILLVVLYLVIMEIIFHKTCIFQIHLVNEFLRSLDTKVNIEFTSYSQYAKLLEEVKEVIDKEQLEYGIEYGEKKGFKTFSITDVFDIPF